MLDSLSLTKDRDPILEGQVQLGPQRVSWSKLDNEDVVDW